MTHQHTPPLLEWDQNHVWHPYNRCPSDDPLLGVKSTQGSYIELMDGRHLIDGMSSWWAAIHGYNHPTIQQAMIRQIETMPHIMFGGLTHEPAIKLCQTLVELTPAGLDKVFLVDSGSVAMEVAIKLSFQYWIAKRQPEKNRLLTVRNGYHGDTFATMAVSDPENGMHHLFTHLLAKHVFAQAPLMGFALDCDDNAEDLTDLRDKLSKHHHEIAAVVLEPIVQGAGGMRFYRPSYLKAVRQLCDEFNVLMVVDEIATGFGRTGKLFACEWAGISPDILCVGKALTGGNLSLAAMLCTEEISETIRHGEPGVLMHGPTFMGNPLACATANASIEVLLQSPWQENVRNIQQTLKQHLFELKGRPGVKDVRVLGAIGVIELELDDLGKLIQDEAVNQGVWLRPFGKLVYTMPAFNIAQKELGLLCQGMKEAVIRVLDKQRG
jgi:adenosylmethionine-8-amino-7-oxononanoate aminotransferase